MKGNLYISDETRGDKIVIKGKKLSLEWLDSYILVYSQEEHKYKK